MNRRKSGSAVRRISRSATPAHPSFNENIHKISVVNVKERVVCLVSGGIDSPVACLLAGTEFDVVPLHFCLYPYTSKENFFTTMNVFKSLKRKMEFEKIVIYPWEKILGKILSDEKYKNYACLACRKSMLLAAERICEREGASGIVTGESLGQKATQTLQNLTALSHGIKFPVLRPLLGLDKLEIERFSRDMGVWHEPHAGDCHAVPKYPRTKANPATISAITEKLDISPLISEELEKVLEVRNFEEDFEEYLRELA